LVDIYTKRYSFITLMTISLLSGILFFCTNHIDFISAAFQYHKLNIPNIAYILMRIINCIFIPAIFLVPSLFPFGRIKMTKICFIAYGICNLLTLSWLFYFFANRSFSELASLSSVAQFLKEQNIIYFETIWDTSGITASILAVIFGAFTIFLGRSFDDDKFFVKNLVMVYCVMRIFFPIFLNLFFQGRVVSSYWVTNNCLDILSTICFTAAIVVASGHDFTWIEFIWDQTVITEEDAEFFGLDDNIK